MHNLVLEAIFTRFPDIKKEYIKLTSEGYQQYQVTYDIMRLTQHESVDIYLTKDGDKYRVAQGRGDYAGGFSDLMSKRINS
jgi:hypothetical protein